MYIFRKFELMAQEYFTRKKIIKKINKYKKIKKDKTHGKYEIYYSSESLP